MRYQRHIPWPILLSAGVHLILAICLTIQPSVTPPKVTRTVHMRLMASEHHAAPRVAATQAQPSPAAPAIVKKTPPPVKKATAVKHPPKPKPAAVAPAAVPTPAPRLAAAPAEAGLAVATKPTALAASKPEPPPVASQSAPATASAQTSSDAGEGEDTVDGGDRSTEALLIHATVVKPEYTSEALFARLEGLFPINVEIDATGRVISAQLVKKVGFGMDQRIIAAIKQARFQPGRDEHGQQHGGWVKTKFKLEIPD